MMSRLKLPLFLALASLLMSGCGIKPGKLTPPQGEKAEDNFPHVYPYDPTGKAKNK